MRCHRATHFIHALMIFVALHMSTAAADDAFDKLFSAGKYQEAIDYADNKLPIAGRDAAVWAKLGVANEEQKLIEKALACYMVGIRLDQKNYEAHLGASRIYNKMNQPESALEYSKKAMEIKQTGEAAWTFAQACITLNRVAEAKAALEKVTETDPSNMVAQRALGNVYYKEKNYSKAVQFLKKAYTAKPDGETALDLANAYKIIGNLDTAVIFYKEASRDRKSAQPEATVELARIYYKKEKFNEAVDEFGKAGSALLTASDLFNYALSIEKINGNKDKMVEIFDAAAKKSAKANSPEVLTAKEKIGRYRLETKRYQDAIDNLEMVRKTVGDAKVNPEILFLIAEAFDGLQQRTKAIPILEAVIARNNKNIEAYARLADLYTKEKMADKAKGIYEKLLSLQPNSPTVYLALGDYNLKAKNWAEAMKYHQKSFTLDAKAPAALGMMKAAWELKQYDIARDAAESALHKDDKLREPQVVLAKIYLQEKNYSSSAAKLEDLLKTDEKNTELLELLAQCYVQLGKKDKLADIDKRIIELDRKNVAARLRFAQYSQESGDVKMAKTILDDLILLQPKNIGVLKSLYDISIKTGDKKEALRYLASYLDLKPNDAALQKAAGDLRYETGDKTGALAAYRAAIKVDPSIKGLYKRYAELVMGQKSGDKAEQQEVLNVLNAAVKAGEADGEIFATLGSIHKAQGNFVAAIDMYQKALQKNPQDVESLSALAFCQEKAGKLAEAIISYEQAAVMNTGSVKEYRALGDLYNRTGKKDQAMSAYKNFLEKSPDSKVAMMVGNYEFDRKKFGDAAKYYTMVSGADANDIAFLEKYADATYQSGDLKKAEETLKILTIKAPQNSEPFRKLYEISLKAEKKAVAADFLLKYTTLKPLDATNLQKLGDLYYELKSPSGALAAYRNLLKADPKAKGFYKKYLELVSAYGSPEEKTAALNGAIAAGEADAEAYIQLGTTLKNAKNHAGALKYFEKASQLDPKSIVALKSVAECQNLVGSVAAAILTYEQVIALDPKADEEYKQLGDLYTKQNKPDNAVSAYKKYLEKSKNDAVALVVGDAALKKGNFTEAISYYDMIKGKDAQQPAFLLNYGSACLKAKNDDKALEIYRKLVALIPQNPDVQLTLFDILSGKGLKDESLVYLKKYVALKPADADAQKNLGDMLYARKDKPGAITAYQAAVKANPKIKGLYKNYSELVIETGKEDEIGSVLAGAVTAGEADVGMYKRLGTIYIKQKKPAQAIPMFEKASQLEPQNVKVLSDLADAQAKSGNAAAAILTYEQVTALNPQADVEYKALGDLYKTQKKPDLSIRSYKKFLEKKGDNAIAREVGQYSFDGKDYSEAIKYFGMVTGAETGTPAFLKMYAEAALFAKDDVKAYSLFKKLSALEPENAAVLNRLYQIASRTGVKDEMLLYLKKYTALQPADIDAQKTLGDLCYDRKDNETALAAFRAVFKASPSSRGYFKKFASLVIAAGKEDEIITVLSGAISAGEADVSMYKRIGSIQLARKNFPAAMSMFEKAVQLDPKNVAILDDLAKAQVAAGNVSAAILTYEQVIAMDPQAEKQYKELGGLYWKQAKVDQALRMYMKYLEKAQDNEIARLVGQTMYDQKKFPEAMKYFGMVTGVQANDPKHLMLYGKAAIAAKDEYKAFQLFKQLATITPKDPDVFERLADLAQRTGTKDDVMSYLKTYAALKPSDANAQKRLGDLLLERKDETGALGAYRAAIKANPGVKGLYKNYATLVMSYGLEPEKELALKGAVENDEADAKMYAVLGDIYTKKGMHDKAIEALEKASRLEPTNDKLLSALAQNQVKKGAISQAVATYEQVIALNPRADLELKALGNLYLQLKKDSLAINCFKKFLDKRPEDSEVSYIVGEASFKRKNYGDAARYFSMVRGEQEKNPAFIRMYGDACYESKDNPRALLQYQKLVKLMPKDPSIYKRLYEINLQSGAKNDALINLRVYTQYMPKDADAQKSFGDLLYEQGNKEEALGAYRNAIAANPKAKGFYKRYVALVLASPKATDRMSALTGAIAAGEADALVYKTLGSEYTEAKNFPKAIEMYREAVKLDQKDASLYLDFSDCLLKSGSLHEASANLEKALQINPSAVKEYKVLGDLNIKLKKTEEAMSAYRKYLEKAPSDEAVAKVVADYYYQQKKFNEAYRYYGMIKRDQSSATLIPYGMSAVMTREYATGISILERVRASKETTDERDVAYKALAEAYERSGNPKKAAEVLFDYVKLPGVRDPDAAYRIAAVYESIDMAQALQMYKSNISSYPKDSRNFLKLGLYFAKQKGSEKSAIAYLEKTVTLSDSVDEVLLQLGAIYSRLNRNEDMLRVYRKFIETAPKNAQAMADIGELLLTKNLVSDALIFLEMANAEAEDNPKYMTLLARGYLMTGQQREGARLLEKVVRDAKGSIDDDLRMTLADVYIATQEYAKAAVELKEVMKTNNAPAVLVKYAETLIASGKSVDALKIAEQIRAKDPENIEAHMMIGRIKVAQKKYNDAIETYKEILYMDQNYAPALCERANVYLLQGKLQWAETFYDRALKSDPQNVLAHLGLARLAKEKKDYATYSDLLEKARKLDPQNREVQAELRNAR